MFKNLTNLGYQRSTKEAFGFYLAYFMLVAFVGGISGGIGGLVTQNYTFDFGVRIGNIVAIIASFGISFLILREKKSLNNFGFILMALLSGLLAIFIGGFGGLIPAAYLTTKPINRN